MTHTPPAVLEPVPAPDQPRVRKPRGGAPPRGPWELPVRERPVLRMQEAASYLCVSRRRVEQLVERGQIETIKLGQLRLVYRASLDRLLGLNPGP